VEQNNPAREGTPDSHPDCAMDNSTERAENLGRPAAAPATPAGIEPRMF